MLLAIPNIRYNVDVTHIIIVKFSCLIKHPTCTRCNCSLPVFRCLVPSITRLGPLTASSNSLVYLPESFEDNLSVDAEGDRLDSTPQMHYIVNNKATATAVDVKEFEDA